MRRDVRLAATLIVLAVGLWLTAVPGIFTIDEDNYIATIVGLRDGGLQITATEGLPPSRELLSFDPAALARSVTSTPVASVAPPIYALFGLPFSPFGMRGLVLLQVLAFAVCAYLAHRITRRATGRQDLAWLALGTFVLASFSIEYAQGAWPHMLAVALVLGAFELTEMLDVQPRTRRVVMALLAGVCAGAAAGVRYQNVALAALLGLTLLIWKRSAVIPYVFGVAIPLLVSGAMNARRIGSWNPISKGPGYTHVAMAAGETDRIPDALFSTWARIVDFTAWEQPPPDPYGTQNFLRKNPDSGAFQLHGALKKSLLQSSPWALVSLLAIGLAWRRRREGDASSTTTLRRTSLLVAGVIAMLSLYGFRSDGWCFNQRYLLELMPFFSIALGLALSHVELRWITLAAGAAAGVIVGVLVTRIAPSDAARHLLVMKAPLVIAAATLAAWIVNRKPGRRREHVLAALLGVSLGWSASIHVFEDVAASRATRASNRERLDAFEAAVPGDGKIALVAYYGQKDPFGPVTLERDIVIIDPWIDRDETVRPLVDALAAQGRRIFAIGPLPQSTIGALSSGYRPARTSVTWLFELVPVGR